MWLGASVLGAVALGFVWLNHRALGVSGLYGRLLHWREEREAEKVQRHYEARLAEAGGEARRGPLPVSLGLTFLVSLGVGGALSAAAGTGLAPTLVLDAAQMRLFGGSGFVWLALAGGGFLVGFGTRMGGGCTSGHGLFGCARLQPASLIGTASFFVAAIACSFLLMAL